jgi:hypothetical protein
MFISYFLERAACLIYTNIITVPFPSVDLEVELSPASLEDWSLAVLFSIVPTSVVVRVLHLLLRERKIAVVSRDVGLLSVVAAALPSLLFPVCYLSIFLQNLSISNFI